jgi:hypothetical protein
MRIILHFGVEFRAEDVNVLDKYDDYLTSADDVANRRDSGEETFDGLLGVAGHRLENVARKFKDDAVEVVHGMMDEGGFAGANGADNERLAWRFGGEFVGVFIGVDEGFEGFLSVLETSKCDSPPLRLFVNENLVNFNLRIFLDRPKRLRASLHDENP